MVWMSETELPACHALWASTELAEASGPHANFAETRVKIGGTISDNKGVNVPDAILPLSPFTDKDRQDLAFGLDGGGPDR